MRLKLTEAPCEPAPRAIPFPGSDPLTRDFVATIADLSEAQRLELLDIMRRVASRRAASRWRMEGTASREVGP
jgi:hypothetical protein